jgi:hypothetical protein
MGRRASGSELLEVAKVTLAKAKTVEELRQAQAVVLPLEYGLSLEQTAQAIGVSVGWACQLRTRFVRTGGAPGDTRRCWCPKPIRPLCQAMVAQECTYAYAAVSVSDAQLDTLILPHVNGPMHAAIPRRGGPATSA